MMAIIGPGFKAGDYLYTYHDSGIGMQQVYLRIVKITPKMVWLRGEHSTKPFLKSRDFVESLYPVETGAWHPKIKLER